MLRGLSAVVFVVVLPFSLGVLLDYKFIHQLLSVQKSLTSESCNVTQFRRCNYMLAQRLNLTSLPRSEPQFALILDSLIQKNGLLGFIDICEGNDVYKDCIGQTYDSCISTENLQTNMKLNQSDALGYSILAKDTYFECGAGFSVILSEWTCLINQAKLQAPTLQGCANVYAMNIEKDYENICKYTQDYVDCYNNAMDGCGADLQLVLCEALRITFNVALPQCSLDCPHFKP